MTFVLFSAKGFLQCKQTDSNFKECVLKAGKLAVPELSRGMRNLYN